MFVSRLSGHFEALVAASWARGQSSLALISFICFDIKLNQSLVSVQVSVNERGEARAPKSILANEVWAPQGGPLL